MQVHLLACSFVDRDIFMRYWGGGVGHKSTRDATDFFLSDRDTADIQRQQQRSSSKNEKEVEDEDEDEDEDPPLDDENDIDVEALEAEILDYGYELPDSSDESSDEETDDESAGWSEYDLDEDGLESLGLLGFAEP